MPSMKKLLFVLSSLMSSVTYAQIDVMRYFEPRNYFSSLISGYEKLEFKWTLPDRAQVAMNEGINALDERIMHWPSIILQKY
jgi:hypothetical protein